MSYYKIVNPEHKSKLNMYDSIFILTTLPYPNFVKRFLHKVLLGWKWEDLTKNHNIPEDRPIDELNRWPNE